MSTKNLNVLELHQTLHQIVDRIPSDFGGGSPLSKTFLMSYIMLQFDLKNYVEIGVYKGRSFFPLAHTAKMLGGMAFGIDAYDSETAKEHDLEVEFRTQVNSFLEELDFSKVYEEVLQLQQELNLTKNSLILKEKSSDAANYFRMNKIAIDMLHIDGNHDTKYVNEDVESYLPFMSTTGFVVMDDINWDSVKQVFDRLKENFDVVFTNGQFAILFTGSNKEALSLEISNVFNALHSLIETLGARQQDVQSLSQKLQSRVQAVQALKTQISEKEENIHGLNTIVGEKEKNIQELNVLIGNIYSSNSWKATQPLRDLKILVEKLLKLIRSFIYKAGMGFYHALPIPGISKKGIKETFLSSSGYPDQVKQLVNAPMIQEKQEPRPSSPLHIQQETYISNRIDLPSFRSTRVIDRCKISVVVISYNHEKYIEQCLNGILMQNGFFNLEIILGDDNSTDNTPNILQKYYEMHPDNIKIMPKEANLGVTKNLKRCLDACNGDYIAICEGDDYWIDEYKLQKQMEFLEAQADYSMCFSGILIIWEGENKLAPFPEQKALNKTSITVEELIDVNYIGNFSCCMYRAESIRKLSSEIFDVFTVDWMFNLACGTVGKIGFIKEWMSVYRKHSEGVWSGKSNIEQVEEMLPRVDTYNKLLNYKYDSAFMKYKEKLHAVKAHYQANLSKSE